MRIAVAGGTGVVGRYVVAALAEAQHVPIVLARSTGVDITTGEGLDGALVGVDAVIDVSNVVTTRRRAAVRFFTAGTQQLLAAGRRAGVGHHVALSIVGVDRVDFGYYLGKRAQEELVLTATGSVLRATQFHEFAAQIMARSAGPLALVPRMRIQPVAAREVAVHLAALAAGPPVGLASELAGPQEHELVHIARRLVRHRGQHRHVLPVRLPGAAGRGMATGALLPAAPGPRGKLTFDQWLTNGTGTDVDPRRSDVAGADCEPR